MEIIITKNLGGEHKKITEILDAISNNAIRDEDLQEHENISKIVHRVHKQF